MPLGRRRETPIPPEVFVLGNIQDDVSDEMTPMQGVHVRDLPPSPVPASEPGPRQVTIIPPAPALPTITIAAPRIGVWALIWGAVRRAFRRR